MLRWFAGYSDVCFGVESIKGASKNLGTSVIGKIGLS